MNSVSSKILERVINQALMSSQEAGVGKRGESVSSEDLIGKLIGQYIGPVRHQDGNQGIEGEDKSLMTYIGVVMAHYSELKESNTALASALGACECWGEDFDCVLCEGEGSPGWTLPDEEDFSEYIRPALAAIKQHKTKAQKLVSVNTIQSEEEINNGNQ
ncbi:MAG: hypothetical protein GY815_05425 [Gammaproteobacteria bacterium]|nr:hypothetical protein [Gammaproteobacteria bacterium]